MDHSQGFQIPEGVLPEVTVLNPGLALMFRPPQFDKRQLDAHVAFLNRKLPIDFRAAFIAVDTTRKSLESVIDELKRRRKEALEYNRVFFIFTPLFQPRLNALAAEADHTFFYLNSPAGGLIMADKVNGETNRAVPHISITLDPNDPDPSATVEFMIGEYFKDPRPHTTPQRRVVFALPRPNQGYRAEERKMVEIKIPTNMSTEEAQTLLDDWVKQQTQNSPEGKDHV